MLSKEEKLRYGEILRQQMKEKEDRKRQEDMMKRGPPPPPPIPKVQSDRILLADPNVNYNIDPKELLQKKLQAQDYNPFGRAGGGAPNPKHEQNVTVNAEGNYSGMMMSNQQQYQQRQPPQPMYNGQEYLPVYQNTNPKYPMGTVGSYEMPKNVGYRQPEPPLQQQQQLPPPQQYQKPINDYPPRLQFQEYPPNQPQMAKMPMQYQQQPRRGYPPQQPQPRFIEPPSYHQVPYSQPTDPRLEMVGPQGDRVRTLQNQQMQEMYRKGGRNLLKLQNQTINEHLVKQKQKLEMQAFLKQQMEEVQHRKQMQKEKIKREEMQEERKNKEYLQGIAQKTKDQERKKNEEKQRIVDQNLRNLAKRKQMQQEAKDKLEREHLMQIENEKRRQQQGRQQQEKQRGQRAAPQSRQRVEERGGRSKLSREEPTDSLNSTSSQNTTQGKGFNTEISRQFFRKQRQREPEKFRNDKKLEMFTNQIQKMRDEINNQGEMFQKQIERIKREAENAQVQKKKAQFEIEKLKLELEKKNREAEIKLLEALKRNDPYPPYPQKQDYRPPYQEYDSLSQLERTEQRLPQQKKMYMPPTPPKMPKTNKIQQYDSAIFQEQQPQKIPHKPSKKAFVDAQYQPRRFDESEVMTLDADSKKIPIASLQGNSKLTMSKIENYGKDNSYYQQSRAVVKPLRQEPTIMEEMQQSRVKSRKSQRQMDELDRLVGSREAKRWQMSTVKDDITKQIEQLLKKKQNRGSDNSKMSEAGRQVLSRGGLPYEGNLNTMSSNRISAVSNGTLDIDKVYDRNEARLRQLKALGVQTINTTGDQDLNRLNELLKHYQ